jgi:hypothetical protein
MQVRYQAALRPDEVRIISEDLPLLPTFRRRKLDKTTAPFPAPTLNTLPHELALQPPLPAHN